MCSRCASSRSYHGRLATRIELEGLPPDPELLSSLDPYRNEGDYDEDTDHTADCGGNQITMTQALAVYFNVSFGDLGL